MKKHRTASTSTGKSFLVLSLKVCRSVRICSTHRYPFFNTDQGTQFSSNEFTDTLNSKGVSISMDGPGRATDNIFTERLWWSVKYHYLYLHTFDNGREFREGLTQWFSFYNGQRFHQGLDNMTPDEIYFGISHPLPWFA